MPPAHASATTDQHFADRLFEAINRRGAPACVGLDPVVERLPPPLRVSSRGAEAQIEAFCIGVIDAVAGIVPALKPQSACFERYGSAGVAVLERTIAHAQARGLIVILDAKRGDIGVTADHYAAAAFDALGADAVTVNGYLGPDTLEPFLRASGGGRKGVFVLVRTSNPGSDLVQAEELADGRTVAELMAEQVNVLGSREGMVGACGLSAVGAVVAATKPADAKAMRARMARTVFLVPGYGTQGGTLEDCRALVRPGSSPLEPGSWGVLITASRSVIYPSSAGAQGEGWRDAIAAAAEDLCEDLALLAG